MTFLRLSRWSFSALPLLLAACNFASSEATDSNGSLAGPSSDSRAPAVGAANASGSQAPTPTAGETYAEVKENDFIETSAQAVSTFAADVDTGSYSIMRRDINAGRLPAPASVRPEEYLNYFSYGYTPPTEEHPFSVSIDGAPSKFGENLHLVRIGLQGKVVEEQARKSANLVFLVDVSGSMQAQNKLPLVQYSLKQLVKRLASTDTLSIVTYVGSSRVVIAPTEVSNKAAIYDAIDGLTAGGGTNGEGGIRKAYELAEQAKRQDGINRVVLCTDGDFNVGVTGGELITLIEQKRDTGINLTTLGFGEGNYNDKQMEQLADHGNGNYAYIDGPGEANRALGEKLVSTLQVVAKDVKIQVEFKPEIVQRYRLIGYENRVLSNTDFRNDAKDAGELGAGHSVTALYEVALKDTSADAQAATIELATVRLRYKGPDATAADAAIELSKPLTLGGLAASFEASSPDFQFAAAITEYSEILRHSKHSQGARFDDVLTILGATGTGKADRTELLGLVQAAQAATNKLSEATRP